MWENACFGGGKRRKRNRRLISESRFYYNNAASEERKPTLPHIAIPAARLFFEIIIIFFHLCRMLLLFSQIVSTRVVSRLLFSFRNGALHARNDFLPSREGEKKKNNLLRLHEKCQKLGFPSTYHENLTKIIFMKNSTRVC